MLDTEIPIHQVRHPEIRVHHREVTRRGGGARSNRTYRKNRAIPVEVRARNEGRAEIEGATKGLGTRGSDGYGRGAAAGRGSGNGAAREVLEGRLHELSRGEH